MERKKYRYPVLILLIAMYSAGFIGLNIPAVKHLFLTLTPFNLLVSFFIILYWYEVRSVKFYLLSAFVFISAYLIEVLGVHTQLIFGSYSYGSAFGLKLFEVPLLIGINWLMLIFCTASIAERWLKGQAKIVKIAFAAFLMILLDFFIEPIAGAYDFWYWAEGIIPHRNFIAWFFISALYHTLFFSMPLRRYNYMAEVIYFCQIIFFIGLFLISR
ncbi:MAG: carotenoid biosynthesis protein [Cytophagaceae bacterium]